LRKRGDETNFLSAHHAESGLFQSQVLREEVMEEVIEVHIKREGVMEKSLVISCEGEVVMKFCGMDCEV
jgi:hypothetical protein